MCVVKRARENDLARLLEVKPALTRKVADKRWHDQNRARAVWLVAWLNDDLVGYVFLKWAGKRTHPEYPDFEDLYVRPDKRAQGVAKKLIDEGEKMAKRKGFSKIGMAVNPETNDWVHEWYERMGYRHDGKPAYVDGIYNGIEDWCIDMEKEL